MLGQCNSQPLKPLWALVPDVVADMDRTMEMFYEWLPKVQEYGFPIAFAVQDGMTYKDVPPEARVVFVGGTLKWKYRNISQFVDNFPTHVGRINTYDKLCQLADMGVESVDGSGWTRGDRGQFYGLRQFLSEQQNNQRKQISCV